MGDREHVLIPTLKRQLADRQIGRREFLRFATLLGMSAPAAYAAVGAISGGSVAREANAQSLPRGGNLRLALRLQDISAPHASEWLETSNLTRQVVEYLTRTDADNITRPYLLEKWEASPDLKSWTLHVRRDIKWRNGRPLVADDVVWNLKRVLDPQTGSSVLGLMKGFLIEEFDTGEKDQSGNPKLSMRLWDSNAVEKVDDFTVRLNGATPQIAVPEFLFHFPLAIMDPEGNGVFKVGSNGTGAFNLVEFEVGRRAVLEARTNYWGEGPYIDKLEFIDLGDDPAASIGALASKQVQGIYQAEIAQIDALSNFPHLQMYEAPTAQTAVARMQVTKAPFDNKLVRQAMRAAIDSAQILKLAHRGLGLPGEHHHVCPIHPEYAKLPEQKRDVERARQLLAEAGHPDGIDVEIACKPEPAWELNAVQGMVEQWKDAGIRVKINVMPSTQYWEVWTEVPLGFTNWTHRPLGTMNLALGYRTGVPWNESKYSNAEFDELLTKAEGTIEVEERRKIMERIEQIMIDDGPIVQPIWRSVITFMDKQVQGFKMHPTSLLFANELAMSA